MTKLPKLLPNEFTKVNQVEFNMLKMGFEKGKYSKKDVQMVDKAHELYLKKMAFITKYN